MPFDLFPAVVHTKHLSMRQVDLECMTIASLIVSL